MSGDSEFLANSLSVRLNMQIALSSTPVVEEWMDTNFTRWLESIPTPMEMPRGAECHFRVRIASDLSRVEWAAHGTPPGFIPKLSKYLNKSGATPTDLDRINAIGEGFEPNTIGSWIFARSSQIVTGWQFIHPFALDDIEPHLGEGREAVVAWLRSRGVSELAQLHAPLEGDNTSLTIPVAQGTLAETLESANAALAPTTDASAVVESLRSYPGEQGALHLTYSPHNVTRLAVSFAGIKSDDLASLCRGPGIEYDSNIMPIEGALGADGIRRITVGLLNGTPFADAEFVPGTRERQAPGN